MIQIYYGFGKGKTTAALGAGMRAKGAGKSVLLVQFLKDNKSSELSVLPFDVFEAPESLAFNPDMSYKAWIEKALKAVEASECDMIILDEYLDVIPKYLSVSDARAVLNKKDCEYIITGHKEIAELFDTADYITFMDKIKHPYDSGVEARRGIEF